MAKKAVQTSALSGADYVVRAEHPRRPGQPLRITTKDGALVAVSGQTCADVAPELLELLVQHDYVVRVTKGKA